MSDNIFDRLFELFQSPGPINWKLAAEVRKSIVGEPDVIDPTVADAYAELAHAAQLQLDSVTHLDLTTTGRIHPVDPTVWATDNEQSFAYALEPLADTLLGSTTGSDPLSQMLGPMAPAVLGMQAGTMVGFMAQQVLGQFDTGLPALDQNEIYLIVPNVESFASQNGLDAQQVRLWAVGHAVVYRALLGVDWMRNHIVDVVSRYYSGVEFDSSGLTDALAKMEDVSGIEQAMAGGGSLSDLLGVKTDETRLAPIQALFASIDGYVDYVVRTGLGSLIPQIDSIDSAIERRRTEPDQASQFLREVVGLDLDRTRSRDAAALFAELAERWGGESLERVWDNPENLPTLEELTDPVGWVARVMLDTSAFEFGLDDMDALGDGTADADENGPEEGSAPDVG